MPKLTAFYSSFRLLLIVIATMKISGTCAQLCPGSLGDPVVNITFGPGGGLDFTPPTAYQYTASDCPNDGSFTITSSTSHCFGDTWHTVNADHTTGHGNFMLINASYEPGDFFLKTVTNLCPNTNYQFSAWIMNVLSFQGIRPNLTFSIESPDGTILQSYSTGDVVQTEFPQWVQYGFYFSTPSDNAVIVLRIRNNAPGGQGNDLAMDDITFRPCGPIINSAIAGYTTDSVDLCEGDARIFTFTGNASSEYVKPAYQWQVSLDTGRTWTDIAGATDTMYVRQPIISAGIYQYRLAVIDQRFAGLTSCRIASNTLVINVHPYPDVNAGPDRIAIAGDTLQINAIVKGDDPSFTWSPPDYLSDVTITNPVSTPQQDITYTLSAESAFGCKTKDDLFVKVVKGIFIPTAFTPNGDGKNDHWHIPYLDPVFGAEVLVYNRWGQLVYHTKGQTVDWDGNLKGQPLPAAVYVYLIHFNNNRPDRKGTVTLIR
ncbi:MAG: gliding motility-associated C-terminal domain-containing protein [Chitinophagaceae bacterium]